MQIVKSRSQWGWIKQGRENFFNKIGEWTKTQTVQGALILAVILLIYLSPPILGISDSFYTSLDFTQTNQLVNITPIQPGVTPKNSLMGDPAAILVPWMTLNHDLIREGQFPLWNRYNGGGTPLLANPNSSIFSPYTWPFVIFNLRSALIAAAFLKLYASGLFTFLFLKEIRLKQLAALVGAVAFMLSGHNLLWLDWIINTATITCLPMGLFFAERLFRHLETRLTQVQSGQAAEIAENEEAVAPPTPVSPPSYLWSLMGLSISLAIGLLSGHPETFLVCLLFIGAYCLYRLIYIWLHRRKKSERPALAQTLKLTGWLVVAGIAGLLLSAGQMLPFAEYLYNSDTFQARSQFATVPLEYSIKLWPLLFFPRLLGSTSNAYNIFNSVTTPGIDYPGFNSIYSGGLILILMLLALLFIRRSRHIWFFWVLAVVWILFATNFLNLGIIIRHAIPVLSTVATTRTQAIFLFSACCLGALGLHHLLTAPPAWRRILPVATLGFGLVVLFGGLAGAFGLLQSAPAAVLATSSAVLWNSLPPHLLLVVGSCILGLLVIYALLSYAVPRKIFTRSASVILVGVVFAQTGLVWLDYNPVVNEKFFYPQTEPIRQTQATVKDQMMVSVGDYRTNILANTNIMYKLRQPSNYDGLWIRYYDELYNDHFILPGGSFTRDTQKVDPKGLKLFGINYVLSADLVVEGAVDLPTDVTTSNTPAGEITPGHDLVQTFTTTTDTLSGVGILMASYGRTNDCNLLFQLTDVGSNEDVYRQLVPCKTISNNFKALFEFPEITGTKNKKFKITLSSADAEPGHGVTAFANTSYKFPDQKLTWGGQPVAGNLVFNYSADQDNYKLVNYLNTHRLYQFKDAKGEFYTVGQTQLAQDDKQALNLVEQDAFDPYNSVVISADKNTNPAALPAQNPTASNGKVTILKDESTSTTLRVEHSGPVTLVITRPFYPGWKVKVNGVEKPLLRANYAFNAVVLGDNDTSVEFYYDPFSFKLGVSLAGLTLLVGVGLGVWQLSRRRRKKAKIAN